MNVGLLWSDFGTDPLAAKIQRAAQRYRARFGQAPDICYVHPTALAGGTPTVPGISVKPSAKILQGHLWLGREAG